MLLISNEVLSHLLSLQPNQPGECLGTWLTEAFLDEGCRVSLIGFIRDQPSYLNSEYTQQVKQFGLNCSFQWHQRWRVGWKSWRICRALQC